MLKILTRMPKVELHVHLEGSIPIPALWHLVRKYGGDEHLADANALEHLFQFVDFPHFIDTWIWMTQYFREAEDFTFIADQVAADLARQNIRYAELIFAPGGRNEYGLGIQKVTEAVRKGLDRHRDQITVNLVGDLIRDMGPVLGEKWLRDLNEVKESCGVIGIGIGGSEQRYPPEPYAPVYELARSFGFRTSAHAGEAAGPASIWGAVRALKVDRLGHATRAWEDPLLEEHLRIHRIPLEMCPISNLRTGVVADYALHPVQRYYERGLLVTINSDDPKMFNTSLETEYAALMDRFHFAPKDIRILVEHAIEAAWCPENQKKTLLKELDLYFAA